MNAARDWGVFRIHVGDCRDVLAAMPDNSVDSIVTDPPYELTVGKRGGTGAASMNVNSPAGRARIGTGGFMGQQWDATGIAHNVEMWAECLRVLKPGGHLLAFGGTRTFHRLACAIEDAGFEIRDQIGWAYGSGFPKSLDVSKAIDKAAGAEREVISPPPYTRGKPTQRYSETRKVSYDCAPQPITAPATNAARQWQGWGTALKPAWEPICVARKPLVGTVASNVLAHGTGAMNIDACRVPTTDDLNGGAYAAERQDSTSPWAASGSLHKTTGAEFVQPTGRWPANLILDGSDEVLAAFPQAPGQLADASSSSSSRKTQNVYGAMKRGNGREGEPSQDSDNVGAVGFRMKPGARRGDSGSAARFFYCAKASRSDRNAGLDGMPETRRSDADGMLMSDPRMDRPQQRRASANHHPTVKPTDLMRYLCRLVTPPGGIVFDPFLGSGSTGKAAVLEGFRFVGCDLSAEYADIAERRIAHAAFGPLAFGAAA